MADFKLPCVFTQLNGGFLIYRELGLFVHFEAVLPCSSMLSQENGGGADSERERNNHSLLDGVADVNTDLT